MALFKRNKEKKAKGKKSNEKLMRRLMLIAAVLALVVGAVAIARPAVLYTVAGSYEAKGNDDAAYSLYKTLDDYKDSKAKAWNIQFTKEKAELASSKIGASVFFGAYEQDNDENNGKEAIEWIVLAKDDGKVLLLADKILDAKPYNTEKKNVTWETSTIRAWLNGEFFDNAFHADEKALISEERVLAERNPDFNTRPGKTTRDKMFLLSNEESLTYIESRAIRSAGLTAYAQANGAYNNGSTGTGFWWLRNPGDSQDKAEYVYYHGYVESPGAEVDKTFYGVRPAMWVNLLAK